MPSLGLTISYLLKDEIPSDIKVHEVAEEKKKEENEKKIELETQEKEPEVVVQETKLEPEPKPKPVTAKHSSTPKCKNKDLEKIGDELNALLNDSSDNINSLNARISLSMNIADTMQDYFDTLKRELAKREGYKKVNGRLDYSLAKRFLWTTFNNLVDIDSNVITLRISSIRDDLKFISDLEEDFHKKTLYPLSAFEKIFLNSQVEYTLVKQMTLEIVERLNLLQNKEQKLTAEKEKKKLDLARTKDKEIQKQLIQEIKVLNGTYVDIVHMMAKLKEIHKKNAKRLLDFETTYKENFYKTFQQEASKHKANIANVLNAQAYLLDSLLWKEAKSSEVILQYFKSLSIDIELNTKTYLKYYLSTLDENKANKESKDLFAFYDYLEKKHRDYILILTASPQEAMDYTQSIKSADKTLIVKSFISELESIKWAMANTVKVLILESTLMTTTASKYLDYYHSHIFSKPKIILIGDEQNIKSTQYVINKQLPSFVQSKQLASTLKQLL
jgi:hypothetical protein